MTTLPCADRPRSAPRPARRAWLVLVLVATSAIGTGCGSLVPGNLDFTVLLTCATDRQQVEADLQWVQFVPTVPAQPRPNDLISMRMALIASTSQGDPVGLPSNLRLFLSFDQQLDANDYLVAEYVVDNLNANLARIRIDDFRLPRPTEPPTVPGFEDAYFPVVIPDPDASSDPNYDPFDATRPEYIGPESITYFLIGVLDSSNCIGEYNPNSAAFEPATREDQRGPAQAAAGYGGVIDDPAINNQIVADQQIEVFNPNLPNLTCRFRELQPPTTTQQGGLIITDWEILNDGIGPVLTDFAMTVWMSEDEDFDGWDVQIGGGTINGPLFSGGQIVERLTCQLPYQVTRANTAATAGKWSVATTADALTVPPGGAPPNPLTRNPPPQGPPSVTLTVYAPIPNINEVPIFLIAMVDSGNAVREQVENDNFSYDGDGINGALSIRETPLGGGYLDIEAISITALVINGFLEIRFRMTIDTDQSLTMSLGYHLSEDDQPASGDYFWNRFLWTSFGRGEQEAFLDFPLPIPDVPAPIEWHFVGVADDVFAIPESNDNNNYAIDIGAIRIN